MTLKVTLLNVNVDNVTAQEVLQRCRNGTLLTLHVDMIMKLQKDKEFYELLPHFDIITCDSQILYFAAKVLRAPFRERVSGSDLFPKFYEKYKDDPTVTVFLCGGATGVAEVARTKINAKVGREMIVGAYSPPFDYDQQPAEIERMISLINSSRATVLVVGLGAGRQEKFMLNYRERFEYVQAFLPFGGTIDYEAGTLERPPVWITNLGFEWLYRLLREPRQRWYRYLVHQPPVLWLLCLQFLGLYKDPFLDEKTELRTAISNHPETRS